VEKNLHKITYLSLLTLNAMLIHIQ